MRNASSIGQPDFSELNGRYKTILILNHSGSPSKQGNRPMVGEPHGAI